MLYIKECAWLDGLLNVGTRVRLREDHGFHEFFGYIKEIHYIAEEDGEVRPTYTISWRRRYTPAIEEGVSLGWKFDKLALE